MGIQGDILKMEGFLERMKGRWIQVKSENLDAIYVASQTSYVKRSIASMMSVHLQIDLPDPTKVFMSFQTKLKNMDLKLNLQGESDHLGLNDEPVKSNLKITNWFYTPTEWPTVRLLVIFRSTKKGNL